MPRNSAGIDFHETKVGPSVLGSHPKLLGKIFSSLPALNGLTDTRTEPVDLTSFNQLVHEFIGGTVRRHKFTPHELQFLLDLQACHIRKSAQPDLLRRYLKVVQRAGAEGPPRLSVFVQNGVRKRPPKPTQEASETPSESQSGLSSGVEP